MRLGCPFNRLWHYLNCDAAASHWSDTISCAQGVSIRGHARDNADRWRSPSQLAAAFRRGDNRALGFRVDLHPLNRTASIFWAVTDDLIRFLCPTILSESSCASAHLASDVRLCPLHVLWLPQACHKKSRLPAGFLPARRIWPTANIPFCLL